MSINTEFDLPANCIQVIAESLDITAAVNLSQVNRQCWYALRGSKTLSRKVSAVTEGEFFEIVSSHYKKDTKDVTWDIENNIQKIFETCPRIYRSGVIPLLRRALRYDGSLFVQLPIETRQNTLLAKVAVVSDIILNKGAFQKELSSSMDVPAFLGILKIEEEFLLSYAFSPDQQALWKQKGFLSLRKKNTYDPDPRLQDLDIVCDMIYSGDLSVIEQIASKYPELLEIEHVAVGVALTNGMAVQYFNQELKKNRLVGLAAVRNNGLAIQFLDPNIQRDEEIVFAAIQNNEVAFRFLPEDLQKNRDLVLRLTQCNYLLLTHGMICVEFQRDREFITAAQFKQCMVQKPDPNFYFKPNLLQRPKAHEVLRLLENITIPAARTPDEKLYDDEEIRMGQVD